MVMLSCTGCGNKEIPVDTWESIQSVESVLESQELSQQETEQANYSSEVLDIAESTEVQVFEPVTLYTSSVIRNVRRLRMKIMQMRLSASMRMVRRTLVQTA